VTAIERGPPERERYRDDGVDRTRSVRLRHTPELSRIGAVRSRPGEMLSEHGLPIVAYDTVENDAGND